VDIIVSREDRSFIGRILLETQSGQADPAEITATVLAQQLTGSDSDYIKFQLKRHEANPLIEVSPSNDYLLVVTIHKNYLIEVSGRSRWFSCV
jgi:hypothetical protein